MAEEQEMENIYPPDAEGLSELLPEIDCGECGFESCIEFAEVLIKGGASPSSCPDLDSVYAGILDSILKIKGLIGGRIHLRIHLRRRPFRNNLCSQVAEPIIAIRIAPLHAGSAGGRRPSP